MVCGALRSRIPIERNACWARMLAGCVLGHEHSSGRALWRVPTLDVNPAVGWLSEPSSNDPPLAPRAGGMNREWIAAPEALVPLDRQVKLAAQCLQLG